ncbi:hypothetical protein [Myxococcus stipitatus]|uniref:hypothetical protein n=1 Tax=Myxococcus stipitatus TaxID=83455 RepID=UPI003AF2760B
MASVQDELRLASGDRAGARAATLTLREQRRQARTSLPERLVHHRVSAAVTDRRRASRAEQALPVLGSCDDPIRMSGRSWWRSSR